jgi:hypothetical protein
LCQSGFAWPPTVTSPRRLQPAHRRPVRPSRTTLLLCLYLLSSQAQHRPPHCAGGAGTSSLSPSMANSARPPRLKYAALSMSPSCLQKLVGDGSNGGIAARHYPPPLLLFHIPDRLCSCSAFRRSSRRASSPVPGRRRRR